MGGGVPLEELPYHYSYRRYPVREHWIRLYSSFFPTRRSNGIGYYYDNAAYNGAPIPVNFIAVPSRRDANLARKRKLDFLKGEPIFSARGQNILDIFAENAGNSTPSSPYWKPLRSPTATSSEAPPKVDAPESKHTTVPSVEKVTSDPDVISIPVIFSDGGKDNSAESISVFKDGTKRSRKAMPAEGAAVLLQSRFRGHLVRKTQPLTNLRTIARVRSQLMKLKEKTSDVDYVEYARENITERVKLVESIMNLLLQLDAIQGAHPVVRDIRKATAKEVISLQEKVDALLSTKMSAVEVSQSPMMIEGVSPLNGDVEILQPPMTIEGASPMNGDVEISQPMMIEGVLPVNEDHLEQATSISTNGIELLPNDSDRAAFMDVDDENYEPCGSNVEVAADILPHGSKLAAESDDNGCDNSLTQIRVDVDGSVGSEIATLGADAASVDTSGSRAVDPFESLTGDKAAAELDEGSRKQHCEESGDDRNDVHSGRVPEMFKVDGPCEEDTAPHRNDKNVVRDVSYDKMDDGAKHGPNGLPETEHLKSDLTEIEHVTSDLTGITRVPSELVTSDSIEHVASYFTETEHGAIQGLDVESDNSPKDCSFLVRSPRNRIDVTFLNAPEKEHQSQVKTSPQRNPDALAEGQEDKQLLKLSQENQLLKSLLVGVMKWNQLQATVMQDVNQRLGKLERQLSTRISKKKPIRGRRRVGKTSRF